MFDFWKVLTYTYYIYMYVYYIYIYYYAMNKYVECLMRDTILRDTTPSLDLIKHVRDMINLLYDEN